MRPILLALVFFALSLQPAHASSGILVIGDSITVASEQELHAYGIETDAQVGRQFSRTYWASFGEPYHVVVSGLERATYRAQVDALPRTVVIALGTNGPITHSDVRAMLTALKGHRVFFVTTYALSGYPASYWTGSVNQNLWWAHYAFHIPLVLWSRHANPSLIAPDGLGVHPNSVGRAVFARLINQRVR